MVFYHRIQVPVGERAIVLVDQVPQRFLDVGSVSFWSRGDVSVHRMTLDELVVTLAPELRRMVPEDALRRVIVADDQRGLVTRRGRAVRVLEPGVHDVWVMDEVAVEVLDVGAVACEPLRGERRALLFGRGYAELTVPDGAVGLRYVNGRLDAVLPPGLHAAWTVLRDVSFVAIDLRERIVAISNQEVMTKDRVSLRVSASVTYRVADPTKLVSVSKDAEAAIYLATQLLLRDAIASHTLDTLLAERDILAQALLPALSTRGAELGLGVVGLGVKDLILPGEMRTLLNRVIEAQKDAEANVIARREETAATRSLAQTAKVLSENPLLVRLKELEAYKDLASRVGTLHVVMGESSLGKLELKT